MATKRVLLAAVLSSAALAAPAVIQARVANYSGNPFEGVQQWANSFYAAEIANNSLTNLTGDMARQAAEVAKVPTFQWL